MDIEKAIDTLNHLVLCGSCTTGPCKDCDRKNAKDTAIQGLQELQQYRHIGTVDEFRVSRPKIIAQNAINVDGKYVCPVCGRSADKYYDLHCSFCGQALKWGD